MSMVAVLKKGDLHGRLLSGLQVLCEQVGEPR
jgi:hypothetical protein